jgi:hypothetical protein
MVELLYGELSIIATHSLVDHLEDPLLRLGTADRPGSDRSVPALYPVKNIHYGADQELTASMAGAGTWNCWLA